MSTIVSKKKVIGIGFHKTGTSTLGDALLELGYTVLGARLDMTESLKAGDLRPLIQEAGKYDALQDVPWAVLYKELDHAFTKSKFVLTERDEQKWLNSALEHFGEFDFELHEWIYGTGVMMGNEDLYLERYRKHNREVREYFKKRPEDLLIVNWENGDGWKKICEFLNLSVPLKNFPHSNIGKHNYTFGEKVYDQIRSLIPVKWRRKIMDVFGFPDRRNRFNNHFQNKQYRKNIKSRYV